MGLSVVFFHWFSIGILRGLGLAIAASIQQILGINQVDNNLVADPATITTRLYFEPDSSQIRPEDFEDKLTPIATWLRTYPTVTLQIAGYAHPDEIDDPKALAYARAQSVQVALEEQGIDLRRLSISSPVAPPPGVTPSHPQWRYQTVLFELN
ncbi:MAG: OmpA family protein [Leptolyngbyaceae cyanobacterium]